MLLCLFQVFIAQLEVHIHQENVNLQSIWFYAQPSLRTMEILANIATTITKVRPLKLIIVLNPKLSFSHLNVFPENNACFVQAGAQGGKVLSLLHEQTVSAGDPKVRKLCMLLTQAACVPYMEILQKWVYIGVIQDPYEEVRGIFMAY